ncbi:hypothetical protein [Sphingobacterium sp.]|uniref:hypothetical protein n=1 Tax=Sphingobacterium sp. TaxID=341027 RepID=UPI0028A06DF8|nr:hypothetical protein [Sphingobacterium sp.]
MARNSLAPGTKVYIIDWYAGMCQAITVIGLSRDTKKLITIVMRAEWVENLRVKLSYNPKVCSKIKAYFDKEETGMQSYTEKFINDMFIGIPQLLMPLQILLILPRYKNLYSTAISLNHQTQPAYYHFQTDLDITGL